MNQEIVYFRNLNGLSENRHSRKVQSFGQKIKNRIAWIRKSYFNTLMECKHKVYKSCRKSQIDLEIIFHCAKKSIKTILFIADKKKNISRNYFSLIDNSFSWNIWWFDRWKLSDDFKTFSYMKGSVLCKNGEYAV